MFDPVWSRQISMGISFAVNGNAYDLSAGVDGTGIEKKQRGVGGNQRVEIDHHPAILTEECAWVKVRIERQSDDITQIINAEGDAGDIILDRSQILDARLLAPQEAVKGSV